MKLKLLMKAAVPFLIWTDKWVLKRLALLEVTIKANPVFPEYSGGGYVNGYAEGDEVKSFADYQPEGSLKGTFFDYIPDGYQVSSFLIDKFGLRQHAQNPTIREMFEKEFKAARMAGKDVFEFMGKPYNTRNS
jgi:hypothetical protein